MITMIIRMIAMTTAETVRLSIGGNLLVDKLILEKIVLQYIEPYKVYVENAAV
jgi:hypothetical protein